MTSLQEKTRLRNKIGTLILGIIFMIGIGSCITLLDHCAKENTPSRCNCPCPTQVP